MDILNVHDPNNQGNVISDRCTFDTYCYTEYLYHRGACSPSLYKSIKMMWEGEMWKRWDLIVIPDHSEIKLQEDGIRSLNHEFRDQVWVNFSRALFLPDRPPLPFIILSGDPSQRITTLNNLVKHGKLNQ